MDYENKETNEIIRKIVSKLPFKKKNIISLYFGFYNNMPMTQQQIANVLGLSQSYISRIIIKTLKDISAELQNTGVIEYTKSFSN